MLYPERLPGRIGRFVLDVLAVLWTAAWALAGWELYRVVVALEVIADAITSTGRTFDAWVRAFRRATPSGIPGISSALQGLANALQRSAGDPLVRSGADAHQRIGELALALGLVVAVLPILTVTGAYLLWRWRDVQNLTAAGEFVRAARRGGRVEQARAVLAHRAVATLPLRQLMRASQDPVSDLEDGRHEALADAMLRRWGMHPLGPRR